MRALIVAYYFPPKGGAGTQRFAKFCKFLPDHGVEPIVLTVDAALRTEHAPHDDASLAVDARTEVHRVATPATVPLGLRLRRRLRLHVDEDEWVHAATPVALRLARERACDVVVTTLSPYACYRIGERLQREAGLPWIVDLRDPWALDGWRVHPSALHARLDVARMRRTLARADFVVANVPEARRAFLALGARPGRCVVIPNGYDAEDFELAQSARPAPRASGGPLQLVHIGTFHPADTAAGPTRNTLRRVRTRQLVPLGRTGFYLLHAIARWRDAVGAAAARSRLAVQLFGQVDRTHRELIDELRLGELITVHGYVPHRASVAALLTAHAVFVPLHDVPSGERALVVPGKLYEALASERFVVGALPAGDGADLVRRLAAGAIVGPTDVGGLAAVIGDLTEQYHRGALPHGAERSRLTPFSRVQLTARFARLLTAAVERRADVQLADPWSELGPRPETA